MKFFAILIFLKPFIYERMHLWLHTLWSGLVVIYALGWVLRKKPSQKDDRWFFTTLFMFLCSIVVAFLYAVVVQKKAYFDSMHLYTLISGVFFSFLAFHSGAAALSIIKTCIFSAGCICLLALYSLFFASPEALTYLNSHNTYHPFIKEFLSRQRAFFPFVSPDSLGGFLILTFFPTLSLIKKNRAMLALLSLQITAIVFTKSIGTYCALLGGLTIYYGFHRKGRPSLLIFLLAGLGILGAILFIRQTQESVHLTPFFALRNRIEYILDGWQMIRQHPWSGWGLGHFHIFSGTKYAHNFLIQLWAETGFLSVVTLGIVIGTTFLRGLRMLKALSNDERSSSLLLSAFCAYCAFILHNLIDFEFFIFQASFLWWLYMGFIHYEYATRTARDPTTP